jgi:hypothetical protein
VRRSRWNVGLATWWIGCLRSHTVSAYVVTGQDWTYHPSPMGESWIVCSSAMPGGTAGGGQRTKDGAAGWNDADFHFTFGADACASGGLYPNFNNVNQVDYGGGLGAGVLAQTTWFYDATTGRYP